MLKIYECDSAKSDITDLKVLGEALFAYSTKLHGIKMVDFYKCEVKKSIVNEYLNSDVTACTFSRDSDFFAFVNTRNIYIIDIQSKEIFRKIDTQNEEIEILDFDPSSKYIIAGSKDGRVLEYKIEHSSLLSRLCSFPYDRSIINEKNRDKNFVSAFAFCKNYLACSGYDNAIFIIDLATQANKTVITHNRVRVNALCFLDENTLVCAKDDGKIDIISLLEKNSYRTIITTIPHIKQIIVMPNPNYIMISGKSNIVTIIDIKNFKITHSKYIEFSEQINKIELINSDSLVVVLQNNKILHVELPGIAVLKSLILHNSFAKAFELIKKEPMLQNSKEHKALEDRFEKNYNSALKALINQNSTLAMQILEAYKDVKSKQAKIEELFNAFKSYLRFQALFLEKKYALAYAMSSKFEPLKKTPHYKMMEQNFKIIFLNAQRHIMQNNIPAAKALLNEYESVISKKPLIKLLLTQNREFVELLKAIQKRDFQTINALVDKNELFKQIPNYIALNNQIQETLDEIESIIKESDINKAKKMLPTLQGIPHIAAKVEELHKKCKYVQTLQNAYENNDFKSCYEILDIYKYLKHTQLGQLLEKHWSKLIQQCEEYALNGNIRDIKKTLGNLITLQSRSSKIGDLLRVSFHKRVDFLMNKEDFKGCETIIYTYVDVFGIDSEITQLMKRFENISNHKLAITQTPENRPSRDSWRYSRIIEVRQ